MGKPGPVKIKNYGIEFKLRAVQLSSQMELRELLGETDLPPSLQPKNNVVL